MLIRHVDSVNSVPRHALTAHTPPPGRFEQAFGQQVRTFVGSGR